MRKAERKQLEEELSQLRDKRSIDKASWFEHKRYAEEIADTLWASSNALRKEADNILQGLRPIAARIQEIEEVLKIEPIRRIKTEILSATSMGP